MGVSVLAGVPDYRRRHTRTGGTRPGPGASDSRPHPGDGRSALAGIAAHRHSGLALSTRTITDRTEQEQPFVVMRAGPFVDLEGRFFALAADAHHATRSHLTTDG